MGDILYDPECINTQPTSLSEICDAIPGLPDKYKPGMVVPMCGINLQYRDLRGADLSNKNLSRSCFVGTNFTGANFAGACLYMADLSGADLSGANFAGAQV